MLVLHRSSAQRRRTYDRVSDDQRVRLLKLLSEQMTIKQAAESLGINYENAKSIYRAWRLENRSLKKKSVATRTQSTKD